MTAMTLGTPEEPEDGPPKKKKPASRPPRPRGDGGLRWSAKRQRWIAEITIGYTPAGRRIVRSASDKTKTKALKKLHDKLRDRDDGIPTDDAKYTVAEAVNYWHSIFARSGKAQATVDMYRTYIETHVMPGLGPRKLRELTVEDVEAWLSVRAEGLGTRSLRILHSILNRAVKKAQARDKVKRNVVALAEIPEGREGRPSKALTLDQAEAVLRAAAGATLEAYIVLSILIGARTEELRALTWALVDLDGKPAVDGKPLTPPSIQVWRSVREGGDTKTKRSRRTLAMPLRCVEALKAHRERQDTARQKVGEKWQDNDLVFCTGTGRPLDAHNVQRDVRRVFAGAGLEAEQWTPRDLRHTFVSLLSYSGLPMENISRLVGHNGTAVTELVYRHQLRPVMEDGATAMNALFPADPDQPSSGS